MRTRVSALIGLFALALSLWPLPAGGDELKEILKTLSIEKGCIQRSPARCGIEQLGTDKAPFIKMAVNAGMEKGYFNMVDGMCGREAYWRCRLGSSIDDIQRVYRACMTLFIKYPGVGK